MLPGAGTERRTKHVFTKTRGLNSAKPGHASDRPGGIPIAWIMLLPVIFFIVGLTVIYIISRRNQPVLTHVPPINNQVSTGSDSSSFDAFGVSGPASSLSNATMYKRSWDKLLEDTKQYIAHFGNPATNPCNSMLIIEDNHVEAGYASVFLRLVGYYGAAIHHKMSLYLVPGGAHAHWMYDCGTGESWRCYSERLVETCIEQVDHGDESASQKSALSVDTAALRFKDQVCKNLYLHRKNPVGCFKTGLDYIYTFYATRRSIPNKLAFMRVLAQNSWKSLKHTIRVNVEELVQEMDLKGKKYVGFDLRSDSGLGHMMLSPLYLEPYLEVLLRMQPDIDTVFVACQSQEVMEALKRAAGPGIQVQFLSFQTSALKELSALKNRDPYSRVRDDFIQASAEVEILRDAEMVIGRFSSSFSRLIQVMRSQHPSTMVSLDYAWQELEAGDFQNQVPYCEDMFAHPLYCARLAPTAEEYEYRGNVAIEAMMW
eukprot:CAMPEP_0184697232 /NCGR_PEP_ID=MMETSP0313-20130426/4255_1 /TAXON_ID=2792 /ORGANISM="Porphyridium aerugineum, Strain SAG 1380-2" /LENGTH=484 /DNA_ID=CAMNT_0027155997 /DNA_START=379 /DNA_END=1830 /DNA_ORIENTATION=-